MSEFKNKVITNKGLELLSKTLSGEQIQFTRVEMGSGILSVDISSVESLINVRQDLNITNITRKGSKVTLSATLRLEDVKSDYDWTEVGVFAKGKDDVEVLYMYGYTENSSYVSRNSLNEKLISITVMVNSTANVTAIIDNSLVYLTQSEMDAHNDDTSSHPELKTWVQGLFDSFKLTWDNILGKPDTFPPSNHAHTWNAIEGKPSTFPPSEHTHSQYLTDSQKGVFRQIANVGLNDSNFSTTDIATNMYTIVNAMPRYSILMDYIKTGTHYPNLCASIIAKAKADLGVVLASDSNIIIETGNGTNMPTKITIRDNQTFKEYAFIYDRDGTTNHVGKMYQTFGEGANGGDIMGKTIKHETLSVACKKNNYTVLKSYSNAKGGMARVHAMWYNTNRTIPVFKLVVDGTTVLDGVDLHSFFGRGYDGTTAHFFDIPFKSSFVLYYKDTYSDTTTKVPLTYYLNQ